MIQTPQVDFNNTELAFKAKSDKELKRSYWLFRMIDSPFLTKVGPFLLKLAFKLHLPIKGLVRRTLFDLFCGGESLEESVIASEYLASFGVKTILDYSVEGEKSCEGFNATQREILAAIVHGGQHPEVAFTACKMTGLAFFELLEKVQTGLPLNAEEETSFGRAKARINELAAAAQTHDTPLFIDAEESWIQDTIDEIAEQLMEHYNQSRAVVWTTIQLYRHDRLAYLQGLIERSREKGYILGVKLVRGAYLEKEHDRAEEMGYPTPMQANKAATDRDYNLALEQCMAALDHVALCAGTHNEESTRYLTQLMARHQVAPDHPRIWFAQLLGMSDHISFNLAPAGYNCAKYLPYGPVKAVLPYLIRRAEENTAVAGQASRELELRAKERRRRKL